MVLDAYRKIKGNGQAAGVDGVTLDDYAKNLQKNLYRLWNRLTSGSYLPELTREKNIPKGVDSVRSLGIATVDDRIAQQVVRAYLEPKMEPTFHDSSYGYRPNRSAHQAVKAATTNCFKNSWAIDLDIKSFFDTMDHDLMIKAVKEYSGEKWVLMYIERWLKAGTLKESGQVEQRTEGSAQGSVISPLLSNVFLHFVFDKWMEKNYPRVAFERYCDDIIVHCKSETQARLIKAKIAQRFTQCKLSLSHEKTRIVFCKNPNNKGEKGYENESFDFLGFTFSPKLCATKNGILLLSMPCISRKSQKNITVKIQRLEIPKMKVKINQLARFVNQRTAGWINYFFSLSNASPRMVWWVLNKKILKWVIKNRQWSFKRALRWLKAIYQTQPRLFLHWAILKP
jgi:group II intron reverse transcriptase/maturase